MPRYGYVVFGIIALLAGGSALAQQGERQSDVTKPAEATKAVVTMEEPLSGDHWTYEVRDEIEGTVTLTRTNTVTEVGPTEISTRMRVEGKSDNDGRIIFDRSWNMINSGPWTFTPHDGSGIRTPLEVGKTWTFQSNNVNAAKGGSWKQTGSSKVVAKESVTTRAGTFDCFKIEASGTRRNVSDPTRNVEFTLVTWYAPAIDHWVKRNDTLRVNKRLLNSTSIELVSYGRKQ